MVTGTWRQLIQVPKIPFTIELFELSRDAHDQSRFERRRKLTLLSRQAWLPSAEDVITQKLRWCKGAKRSKDFDDAVAVLGVQGENALDWPYIEKWCAEHGTLDVLAEAKAEAAVVWEARNRAGFLGCPMPPRPPRWCGRRTRRCDAGRAHRHRLLGGYPPGIRIISPCVFSTRGRDAACRGERPGNG
jgi:hypothetical protein